MSPHLARRRRGKQIYFRFNPTEEMGTVSWFTKLKETASRVQLVKGYSTALQKLIEGLSEVWTKAGTSPDVPALAKHDRELVIFVLVVSLLYVFPKVFSADAQRKFVQLLLVEVYDNMGTEFSNFEEFRSFLMQGVKEYDSDLAAEEPVAAMTGRFIKRLDVVEPYSLMLFTAFYQTMGESAVDDVEFLRDMVRRSGIG